MSIYLKIFSTTLILLLVGCDEKQPNTNFKTQAAASTTMTISSKTINENIEQTGVVTPITVDLIVSPVYGFITQQNLPYGTDVKKNDKLFVVSDANLSSEVFTKISDYHNAKWDYESSHNKFLDYKLQFKSGLVSEGEVETKEIDFYRAEMKLIQAEFELKKIANKIDKPLDLLKSTNIEKIKSIFLTKDLNDSIVIESPSHGTLIPLLSDPTKETTAANVGSKVEGGQAFAALANLNQGEIKIELSENQVLMLKNGMSVNIQSLSQPNLKFTGLISAIKYFEFKQNSDNMAHYPIIIHVSSETNIIPGTRCKIIIPMGSRKAIIIPINAVNDAYQNPYVIMADGSKRKVELGKTDINNVEIKSGLSPNEKILVPKPS